MEDDGWHTNWLLRIIDPDVNDRVYTASWAETLLQDFVDNKCKEVQCESGNASSTTLSME